MPEYLRHKWKQEVLTLCPLIKRKNLLYNRNYVVLLFYGIVGLLLSWLGIRLFSEIKDGVMELPEIYSTSIEPALNGALRL